LSCTTQGGVEVNAKQVGLVVQIEIIAEACNIDKRLLCENKVEIWKNVEECLG
jgi:stress response protein YsnF